MDDATVSRPWLALALGAAVVVVLTLVAVLLFKTRKGPGGLLTGKDCRISTSRTVVYVWTAIVAWMVATEALIAVFGDPKLANEAASFGDWLEHTFDAPPSRELYLVLLGGPYAAAVMSGVIVQTRVNNETLQKPKATGTSIADAVRDDSGSVDPVDFQYVLFNLLVAVAVALSFAVSVEDGLPVVADFLAILTGGSALTYTLNKGVSTNAPTLTALHPQTARVGDRVTAYGSNLALVSAEKPKVTVAGVEATVTDNKTDWVEFVVPTPAAGTAWNPQDRQRVVVTTAAGLTAARDELRVVLDEPVLQRLEPARLAVASADDYAKLPIKIHGEFLTAPSGSDANPRVEIASAAGTPVTIDSTPEGEALVFKLPAAIAPPAAGATLSLDVNVVRDAVRGKAPMTLTVQAVDAPVLDRLDVDVVEADAGAALDRVEVSAAGAHLAAPGRTLQAQLIDAAGVESDPVEVTSVNDTTVMFRLPPGTKAPEPGTDDPRQVMLKLGTLVSGAQPLILRGRPDPVITALTPDPLDVPEGAALTGTLVTATGDHLVATESDRIYAVSADVKVQLKSANGTLRDGAVTNAAAKRIEFALPDGIARPDADESLEVIVVRGERASAPTSLTLHPV